jgi:hypothetical protein
VGSPYTEKFDVVFVSSVHVEGSMGRVNVNFCNHEFSAARPHPCQAPPLNDGNTQTNERRPVKLPRTRVVNPKLLVVEVVAVASEHQKDFTG